MSRGDRVLVVDDERQIRRFLKASLSAYGYEVTEEADGAGALRSAATKNADVVILDLGLPDMDGTDVIARIREWSDVPIIVLSVRDGEADKVAALDLGADDYVAKPFGMAELLARIRAVLRHRRKAEGLEEPYQTGSLVVDVVHRRVTVRGEVVRLTPKEYDLLRQLVTHAGKVLTHRFLLQNVWGPTYAQQTHYVRVYIRQLRQKLEANPTRPEYILTEPGVGYRLREHDDSLGPSTHA